MRQARKHAKLTQVQAAKRVGVSQGTLSELEQTATGSSYTPQFALVYGVNSLWLADGTGDMLDPEARALTPADLALLELVHALTPDQRRDLIRNLEDQKRLNEQLLAQLLQRRGT